MQLAWWLRWWGVRFDRGVGRAAGFVIIRFYGK